MRGDALRALHVWRRAVLRTFPPTAFERHPWRQRGIVTDMVRMAGRELSRLQRALPTFLTTVLLAQPFAFPA